MVMVKGSYTAIENSFEAVTVFASVVCTVKLNEPVAAGVPDSTPVKLSNVKPDGRLPITDQVYGNEPPVANNNL